MGVVDVQVEHRAADMLRQPILGEPRGIGNDAAKFAAEQFAMLAAMNDLQCPVVLGEERQHVPDHQQAVRLFRSGDHAFAIGQL